MEIENLIEKLRVAGWTNPGLTDKQSLEWDAAIALEQLQAENDMLQAELEKEEAARKKQADILYELRGQKYEQTTVIDQLRAENDRVRRTDMERLTYDFSVGGNHCWQVKGADNLECREVCQIQGDKGCKDCPIAAAFDRLAAYEDTGLTPEEVQQMRWIPVEERLPDKPGHYLVCTNVNYWHGGCMDKNGSSSNAGTTDGYAGTTLSVLDCFYDITGDWNRVCNAHVTHWAPLPSAPKEENKDD